MDGISFTLICFRVIIISMKLRKSTTLFVKSNKRSGREA